MSSLSRCEGAEVVFQENLISSLMLHVAHHQITDFDISEGTEHVLVFLYYSDMIHIHQVVQNDSESNPDLRSEEQNKSAGFLQTNMCPGS